MIAEGLRWECAAFAGFSARYIPELASPEVFRSLDEAMHACLGMGTCQGVTQDASDAGEALEVPRAGETAARLRRERTSRIFCKGPFI